MTPEEEVARHYDLGALERAILAAPVAAAQDPEQLAAAALAPLDEFHLGWLPATVETARGLALRPEMPPPDVGCGSGGPARHRAATARQRDGGSGRRHDRPR
jgi:hypothetical protein